MDQLDSLEQISQNQNDKFVIDQMIANPQRIENNILNGQQQQLNSNDPDRQKMILEMTQWQQKVVLELEAWKKVEEARFRIQLKQHEYEYLQKFQNDVKQREMEREKSFKQGLAQVTMIESKMKQKAQDLQKREQRIVQLEEDLQNKLQETARVIKQKDDEQGALIKKFKDEKLNYEKDKTSMNLKLADSQGQINKMNEEISRLKKEMENSPIALVKSDLQNKAQEILELKKEIDKINQIKDQYKKYYEKVRDEYVRQKKFFEENQQSQQYVANQEISKLRDNLDELRKSNQESQNIIRKKELEIQQLKQVQIENPFKKGALLDQSIKENKSDNIKEKTQIIYPESAIQQQKTPIQLPIPKPKSQQQLSDVERLIRERDYLLESGEYYEDDPLIIEINKHINDLKNN